MLLFLHLRISFSASWSTTFVTYSSNLKPRIGSARGGPPRGRYCLAHAFYGGSNNNMGVEVDWMDVKELVLSAATISAFTGALVKFVADIGTEHQDFLKQTDGLFSSTGVMT